LELPQRGLPIGHARLTEPRPKKAQRKDVRPSRHRHATPRFHDDALRRDPWCSTAGKSPASPSQRFRSTPVMTHRLALAACVLALFASPHSYARNSAKSSGLIVPNYQAALDGAWRSPENHARDPYRHPAATLRFFGFEPGQTVIEITPGNGWYSEILGPMLQDNGHYVAAIYAKGDFASRAKAALKGKFARNPGQYRKSSILEFDPDTPIFGPAASADRVLTFRNVHNWLVAGNAQAMFKGFYAVLKPGGVLGVVEHRAPPEGTDRKSGYVTTSEVITLARNAGFTLDAQSEINANPKDTKNYPQGVWNLPPTLRGGEQDRAGYLAIGESDRMTIRFVKAE
jgi:predicted methyltransferase